MHVLLLSTYELGRQPFGLASPAAWLREAGHQVTCFDLSRQSLGESSIRAADVVACYLPMHTATRLAAPLLRRVRALNPDAHLCAYGLYAPLNDAHLRALGVQTILDGEFEADLVALVERLAAREEPPAAAAAAVTREAGGALPRLRFRVPDRRGLPPLAHYARLHVDGDSRTVGYTEATRGCKHRCRHCPIVPVYDGRFRAIPAEIVLADIRQQVEQGAQHITFGDPDFFNGPTHALAIVSSLAREWPGLTYDVTIKIEHLLAHRASLPRLRDTGCLFITSAVEAVDDAILLKLEKGHTRADFVQAVALCRASGLTLVPTFVAFTPWTTLAGYGDLLDTIADLKLVSHVPSIQWAIRLLIPEGSRLLELEDIRAMVGAFDREALVYPWRHPDPRVDALQRTIEARVNRTRRGDRETLFREVAALARAASRPDPSSPLLSPPLASAPDVPPFVRATVPYLDEPWYC
jgi:radical SAM superfamily enzyme YgiQ (UPF0313 family)